MNKKLVFFTGLMLFSMFFGAGNLIFPPLLGLQSGNQFIPAISGFILTGVLLPFVGVLAVVTTRDGLVQIGSRVHPVFGLVFAMVIYLCIGPFYAIPRAATVAYELSWQQIFPTDSRIPLIIFVGLLFIFSAWVCLNPKKIVDWLGQILTPLLLFTLAILVVRGIFLLNYTDVPADEKYAGSPFLTGFIEGYFTLDAVAGLAFGVVVINTLRNGGIFDRVKQVKGSIIAGFIAALGLAIVYLSLGWIGVVMPRTEIYSNGAVLLTAASQLLFGNTGSLLFGAIVLLACLTTIIGLINACGSFFHSVFPKYSYKIFTILFSVIGFLISSLGLDIILNIAAPILLFIYPIAIVLMALALLQPFIGEGKMMYRIAVAITFVYAAYDSFVSLGFNMDWVAKILGFVPLFDLGLGWFIPTIFGVLLGYAVDKFLIKEGGNIAVQKKN